MRSGSRLLKSALNAGSTLPPLASRTALTTLVSISGKASISVFCAWAFGSAGRGGFCGGISSACSENLTPGLGDFEAGGGEVVFSGAAEDAGASLSSSKSSSRAVVGLSGGYMCQFELHSGLWNMLTLSVPVFSDMIFATLSSTFNGRVLCSESGAWRKLEACSVAVAAHELWL